MTEKKRFEVILAHRMAMRMLLEEQGFISEVSPDTLNLVFIKKSPTQEELDRATYLAFLLIRERESEKGNTVELLDLVW